MTSSAPTRRRLHLFRALAIAAIALVALSVPLGIARGSLPDEIARHIVIGDVSFAHRVLIGVVGSLPALAAIWTLLRVISFLEIYAAGRALSLDSAEALRAIGCGLFAVLAAGLVSRPLQSLAATAWNPQGERSVVITLESGDLGILLAAGLVLLVAQAIVEAAGNRADLDAIV